MPTLMNRGRRASLPLLLLAGLLAAAPALLAPRVAIAADDTELATKMEEMEDDLKKLRKSVKVAAENQASLETLTRLQATTVACKALVPAKAAEMPEADRSKFVAAYRKDMGALLTHFVQIENALIDGDNAKAEELFKGLKKVEDDGHEKYSDE